MAERGQYPPMSMLTSLFDASQDASLWRSMVAAMVEWLGASAGLLYVRYSGPPTSLRLVSAGMSEHSHRAYEQDLHRFDPLAMTASALPVGRLVTARELGTKIYRQSRFYRELCRPAGLDEAALTVLINDDSRLATFTAIARAGYSLDTQLAGRLEALSPLIGRALHCTLRADSQAAERDALATCAGATVITVDANLNLLVPVAQSLSFAGGLLRIADPRLLIQHPTWRSSIKGVVRQAIRTGRSHIELSEKTGRASMRIHGYRLAGLLTQNDRVNLVITERPRDTESNEAPLPAYLAGTAHALTRGLSDKEIAVELGLGLSTARTYVRRTLVSLGQTRRQLGARQHLLT